MILFRIGMFAVGLFLLFYSFLHLCFSTGFLTRERLKKWNRNRDCLHDNDSGHPRHVFHERPRPAPI